MAALAPALIGTGGSLLASWLGNKSSGISNPSQIVNPLMQAQNLGMANAQQLGGQGVGTMTNAIQSMNPVLSYYAPLLAGNRGAMTQALAPQLNQISDAYRTQTAANAALMPRGGGRANLMTALPYQQTQSMLNLYQNARNQAAQGMSQAAGQLGQMGASLIGGANQSLYASTGAGRDLLNYQLQEQQQNRALGSSIGGLLSSGLTDWLGGRGGYDPYQVTQGMPTSVWSSTLPITPTGGGSLLRPSPGIPNVSPLG